MDLLSEATQATLEETLNPGERVEDIAQTVGSALVLTDRRLIAIREGRCHRPVSGVRSFPLDGDLYVGLGPQRKRVVWRIGVGVLGARPQGL